MAFRGKKRALPSEGRTGISESSEVLGGKKVRFGAAGNAAQDSEEEEDVEPADDLEGPSSRRNAVIAPEDGGSSDEESDEPAEPANKALDEDDDMFNSAPSKDTPAPKGKRDETDKIKDPGLGVREGVETGDQAYLKLGDLEGQEFQMLDQSDSDDQEEFEEDDIKANNDDAPRSRRSKKGMGYMMSGFNMKEELSEGRMTSDGSYIANKGDPFSRHDAWLDDVSNRKAIKDARAAKEAKEAQAAQQDAEQAALSRAGCMKELVEAGLLTKHNNENVLGALQRLGTARKAAVKNQQKAAKKQQRAKASSSTQMDVDDQSPESQELDQLKSKIDRLTTLAGTLLDGYGETEVYDWTYDDVVKDLRLEGEVPRGWEPNVTAQPDLPQEGQEDTASSSNSNFRPKKGLINRSAAPADAAAAAAAGPAAPTDPRRYEYMWRPESAVPAQQKGRTFGPFSRAEMESWIGGGFFGGPQADNIQVKQVGGVDQWISWPQLA